MSLYIEKAGPLIKKVYIKPGEKVAPGTKLYHGPHGGIYYIPGEREDQEEDEVRT